MENPENKLNMLFKDNNNLSIPQELIVFDFWFWDEKGKNWEISYKKISSFQNNNNNKNIAENNNNNKSAHSKNVSRQLKYDNGSDGDDIEPPLLTNINLMKSDQMEPRQIKATKMETKNVSFSGGGQSFAGSGNTKSFKEPEVIDITDERILWNIQIAPLFTVNSNLTKQDMEKEEIYLIFNLHNSFGWCKVICIKSFGKNLDATLRNMGIGKHFFKKQIWIQYYLPDFTTLLDLDHEKKTTIVLPVTFYFVFDFFSKLENSKLLIDYPFEFLNSLELILPKSWVVTVIYEQIEKKLKLENPTLVLKPIYLIALLNALDESFKRGFMIRFKKIVSWIEYYFDESIFYSHEWENLDPKVKHYLDKNYPLFNTSTITMS